jgi:hypothetical protein
MAACVGMQPQQSCAGSVCRQREQSSLFVTFEALIEALTRLLLSSDERGTHIMVGQLLNYQCVCPSTLVWTWLSNMKPLLAVNANDMFVHATPCVLVLTDTVVTRGFAVSVCPM